MFEDIYLFLIAALPSISAILGVILAVIKLIKNNDSTIGNVATKLDEFAVELKNTKEMDEVKIAMNNLAQSNRELKKRYDELLTELTKIQHKED